MQLMLRNIFDAGQHCSVLYCCISLCFLPAHLRMYAATVKDGLVSAVEYLTLDGERKIFGVRKLEV